MVKHEFGDVLVMLGRSLAVFCSYLIAYTRCLQYFASVSAGL